MFPIQKIFPPDGKREASSRAYSRETTINWTRSRSKLSCATPDRASLPAMVSPRDLLAPLDSFDRRHTGSAAAEVADMLKTVGQPSVAALADAAVPADI